MHLNEMATPSTSAALAATQVARRYCSSALYAHCVRCYLWGVAYAERQGMDFDRELYYVAAMLHDIGLTRAFDAYEMPFEEAGGQVAWVFGAAAGWPDTRSNRVAQVIGKHMWPSVDPDDDVEGHLLEVATGIDITGCGSTSSRSTSRPRSSRRGRGWTSPTSSPGGSASRVNANRPAAQPTSPAPVSRPACAPIRLRDTGDGPPLARRLPAGRLGLR